MQHLVALLQTTLWVGLTGYVLWRYNKPIESILNALHKRIESGSGLKAGPFEIQPPLAPATPADQTKKLEAEVAEIKETIAPEAASISIGYDPETPSIRDAYLRAEDLGIREIQSEFGVPVSRQVQTGPLQFDGFFVLDGSGYAIELKYSRKPISQDTVRPTVMRLSEGLKRFGLRNVFIIFVVVYDSNDVNISEEILRIEKIAEKYHHKTIVRCFRMDDLLVKYGMKDTH